MSRLGPIDWVIALVYLATTLGLGVWFTGKQADNEEYFLGGRQVNWLAMSLSIFATAFSSISFLAYPREVAYENFQFFVAILCIPLIISPLLAWVFVPFFMNLRCVSAYEYLERRFHPGLRRFGSLLFMAYAIGWMGTMLYAVGLILKTLLSLSDAGAVLAVIGVGLFVTLYTTLGGIKAVIWTDVIQSAVIVGSISLITLCALREIDGGLATVVRLGHEHGKFEMLNFDLDWSQRGTFYAACAFGLFMYLPGYTVSQAQVQRYITVKNLADARRALLLNALLLPAVILVFFFLGTVLFAYYHNRGGLPDLPAGKQDQIMPLFVMTVLPGTGLVGLLVAAIMASAMSSLDSGINSLTAVIVYDWLGGRNLSVSASRRLCLAFGICIIGAALLVPLLGLNVIGMITTIASTFLGLLLGLFLLGMYVPRATTGAAVLGLLSGIVCLTLAVTATSLPHWWYGACTLFPTVIVGWLSSLVSVQKK